LRTTQLDLEKALRAMEDLVIAATSSHKLKQEMDSDYKSLSDLKKDREKEIQQLLQKKC